MKLIGSKIRQLRESHSLSMNQLAKAAGTTHVTIGRIEEGLHSTNFELLESIAKQLGISFIELIDDSNAALNRAKTQNSSPRESLVKLISTLTDEEILYWRVQIENNLRLKNRGVSLDKSKTKVSRPRNPK